jgi:hypothetical protein
MRSIIEIGTVLAVALLGACKGGNGSLATGNPPVVTPALNTVALTVDTGPTAATGAINHAYVTVKVCAAGSQTQCANIDHVLLDTGSVGLRLVRSVLAAGGVTLSAQTDAQGRAIEECVSFVGGQTWGPVALADVTLAGESAAKLPVQVMDDTGAGAAPPSTSACSTSGTLVNGVSGFDANGLLGVGVLQHDCGSTCVNATTPAPVYYGCTAAGVCTAENAALAVQVANPVAMFAADNNGVIVNLPNLQNANGDATVSGELIFGIATQTDNALPATGLTVLGTDSGGDFKTTYTNGNAVTTVFPALIDSGTDDYAFDDPAIPVCSATTYGIFAGYYCPNPAPKSVSAINTGVNNVTNTVDFAIADPSTFVQTASAFIDLAGGGGSTRFTWGMPFFYGRKIYVGIDQRVAGTNTGPYYAY